MAKNILSVIMGFLLGWLFCGVVFMPTLWNPKKAMHILVRGHNFQWEITYLGEDEKLGTKDDVRTLQNIYIPCKTKVYITLTSKDYVYLFSVPKYKLKAMATPDKRISLVVYAEQLGTAPLVGDQMCGLKNENLSGKFVVLTAETFLKKLWFMYYENRRKNE